MDKTNLERLQDVAEGLDELNEKVVYVGGSVAQLYVNDEAFQEARPTMDVDCVVELMSYREYEEFNEFLRKKKFEEDRREGAPICRWLYKGDMIDVMPTDEKFLGFTNKWYKLGIRHKENYTLPNGRTIYIMPVLFFLATKIEAINSRGGEDLRISHDFEDIIYVLNYCSDIIERFNKETNETLKNYLKEECQKFLKRSNIREETECALPLGEVDRVDVIFEILEAFAKEVE